MSRPTPALARLGKAVAAEQDRALARLELHTTERLLAGRSARASGWSGSRRWAALGLAAAVVGLVLVMARPPRTLSFGVGESLEGGRIDDWIAAPVGRPLPVRFSDGTSFELAASSRARVVETSERGAVVVIERGAVEASVVPRAGGSWRVHVGPYQLRVKGTHFIASWEPSDERLTVKLTEGALLVVGPGIEQGTDLSAGSELEARAPLRRWAVKPLELLPRPEEPADAGPVVVAPDAAPDRTVPEAPEDGGTPSGPPPSWRRLFEAGKHREALRRAEALGFDELCASLAPADLDALAEVARSSGASDKSEQALLALRSRFPHDGLAAVAAFRLGLIAYDFRGNQGDASRWFSTYLAEQPAGALAREATGRLLEAAHRAGRRDEAVAAARRYLASYPEGPHAAQAREVLASGER